MLGDVMAVAEADDVEENVREERVSELSENVALVSPGPGEAIGAERGEGGQEGEGLEEGEEDERDDEEEEEEEDEGAAPGDDNGVLETRAGEADEDEEDEDAGEEMRIESEEAEDCVRGERGERVGGYSEGGGDGEGEGEEADSGSGKLESSLARVAYPHNKKPHIIVHEHRDNSPLPGIFFSSPPLYLHDDMHCGNTRTTSEHTAA